LFPRIKRDGLTLSQETFKKEWEGAVRTFSAADCAKVLQQWYYMYMSAVESVLTSWGLR
jgi:hypothetical protein